MPDHRTSVISGQRWDVELAEYVPEYRARCSTCSYRSRGYPLSQRAAAEALAEQHTAYQAEVARMTARGDVSS